MGTSVKPNKKNISFKWSEGRFNDVKSIIPLVPAHQRYIEPFVGNAQFYLEYQPQVPSFLNDTDRGLINFYQHIGKPGFEKELKWIGTAWDLLDRYFNIINGEIGMVIEDYYAGIISKPDLIYVVRVIVLMNTNNPAFSKLFSEKYIIDFDRFTQALITNILEKLARVKQNAGKGKPISGEEINDMMLTTLKGTFYYHFLDILNRSKLYKLSPEKQAALWFFTRETSHGNEFRPGNNFEYTASYGGSAYNNRNLMEKITILNSKPVVSLLTHARFSCLDFEEFLANLEPKADDFVIFNLPLRNSLFNPSNIQFEGKTYIRMAQLLEQLPSKWMVIVRKNEENTPLFKIPSSSVMPVLYENKPGKSANFFIIRNFGQ